MKFEHLKKIGIGYSEHFFHSLKISLVSMYCSIVLMIHAIYPDIFENTGTNMLRWVLTEHDKSFSKTDKSPNIKMYDHL